MHQATYQTHPDQAVTVQARVTDANKAAVLPQFVRCWTLEVVPVGKTTPSHTQEAQGGGAVVLSSLSTTGWDSDATGYNFRHKIPGSAFPDGGNEYVATYELETTTGSTINVCARIQVGSC